MVQRLKNAFYAAMSLDLRSLALLRILIAGTVALDALNRFSSLRAFYTGAGVFPREALAWPDAIFRSPLHIISDSAGFQYVLMAVLFISACTLACGYKTRLFSILTWFILGSLHERNVQVLHSSDVILRLMLFWGVFLPWGERFALGKRQTAGPGSARVFQWAIFGYICQCVMVYFCSALHKTGADWYPDLTAVYYAVGVGEFSGGAGRWLMQYFGVTKFLTALVLLTEFLAPLCLFIPRLRIFGLTGLFLLQLGFGIFLNLGPFPVIATFMLAGLIPPIVWDGRSSPEGITIANDSPYLRIAVLYFLFFITFWNIIALPFSSYKPAASFSGLAKALHIDQYWNMFAPVPPHQGTWITTSAELADRTQSDIWNEKLTPENPTRAQMRETYGDWRHPGSAWRWFKYLQNLKSSRRAAELARFGAYICGEYNDTSAAEKKALTVTVYLNTQSTPLPGQAPSPAQKEKLVQTECPAATVPLFGKGVYPLVFAMADFPLHPKTAVPMQTSADCAPCHKTVYDNWNNSRHRVALTNELYKESHAREPSPWCVNCHAPLRLSGKEKTPYRGGEGISCLVCHVRGGDILTGTLPIARGELAHRYRALPEFKDERLCENCHDFNFPTAASAMSEGKDFHYTDQPMQSTVAEYRASGFYGKVGCGGCHVFPNTKASHSFPGGHAIERLKNDFRLEVRRIDGDYISVRIFAQGIGHAFPTGDLFRTLRIRLLDSALKHTHEIELRHFFEPVKPQHRTAASPLKLRTHEELLPPPQLDYVSMREFTVPWPGKSTLLITELYIDYLAQVNTITTHLSPAITRPLIKREAHRLRPSPQSDVKG